MTDHEGDGVALYATDHPTDEAAAAALLKRVKQAMLAVIQKGGTAYDPQVEIDDDAVAAAINEVRQADYEWHEAYERSIEAATETVVIELGDYPALAAEREWCARVVELHECWVRDHSRQVFAERIAQQIRERRPPDARELKFARDMNLPIPDKT